MSEDYSRAMILCVYYDWGGNFMCWQKRLAAMGAEAKRVCLERMFDRYQGNVNNGHFLVAMHADQNERIFNRV